MEEEEILSLREIAIIERWMEKYQVDVGEPIFEERWEVSMVDAVVSAVMSDHWSARTELPEELWTKLEDIWKRVYVTKARETLRELRPPNGRETIAALLENLKPAQRRALKDYLRGLTAAERKKLAARIEKELAEQAEKLRKDLTHKIGNIEHTLGEAMEERDRLEKTLKEERQQWREEQSHLAKKPNALRSEKKERRR